VIPEASSFISWIAALSVALRPMVAFVVILASLRHD
jgi:hypothetical protein